MISFTEFITEAKRRSFNKPGPKSGKSSAPPNIRMAGMPGSGKSTMATKLALRTGGTSFGFDDAREKIHGDRSNQSNFPEVKRVTMHTLRNANKEKPRILDNTDVNPKFRPATTQSLEKEADMPNAITVSPDTSQRRSFSRNRKRANPVPKFVMRQHMAPAERAFRKTKEGKQAIKTGRELSKRFRLNRRSARAKLGITSLRRGFN